MMDTNRIQVTRMGGGGIPGRWAGELESVVRRPDGALRVTMRTLGEGVVTIIGFDADDVGWIVAAAQPEPLAEPGPWEPMFEGAAESAAARIADDASRTVGFVGAAEVYREALQAIADGARDPVSVAWKALSDAGWFELHRKANEPLRAPNTVTTPDPAKSWTINEGEGS